MKEEEKIQINLSSDEDDMRIDDAPIAPQLASNFAGIPATGIPEAPKKKANQVDVNQRMPNPFKNENQMMGEAVGQPVDQYQDNNFDLLGFGDQPSSFRPKAANGMASQPLEYDDDLEDFPEDVFSVGSGIQPVKDTSRAKKEAPTEAPIPEPSSLLDPFSDFVPEPKNGIDQTEV